MKKFEIMTTETINTLSSAPLRKELRSLNTESNKLYQSTWSIAETYARIIAGELFADDFDSLTAFAKFAGTSTSNISRLTRCVDFRDKYGLDGFTVGAIAELLPLENCEALDETEILQFVQKLEPTMTVKALREAVKWLLEKPVNPLDDEPETVDTETVDEPAEVYEPDEVDEPDEVMPMYAVNELLRHFDTYRINGKDVTLTVDFIREIVDDYITENNLTFE